MTQLALVTGATAGIGRAFAEELAREGADLVVVARDRKRLAALQKELPVSVEVLPADLSDDAQLAAVEERLRVGDIDMLVNNAGFGTYGSLHEIDVEEEDRMLRVNVRAVLRLTSAALPGMVAQRGGEILNVSSMAGFLPGSGAATYAAAKAWVTTFSQALNAQYTRDGIHVTAACPGFVHTEFHERLGGMPSMPEFMWLNADEVVKTALRDLRANRDVSVPGVQYKVLRAATRGMPDPVRRRFAAVIGRGRGRD